MACESCSAIQDAPETGEPYVVRTCEECGRKIRVRERGKHGIGIEVKKGDQFVLPEGFIQISANPLKGGGQLSKPGSADVPVVPIVVPPGSESDADIAATLSESDEAAIDIAVALADARNSPIAQDSLIENYRDHQRRSQSRRDAEKELFREAGDRIRRDKRGWSKISDRELTAGSPEERQRARKTRNKSDQRARGKTTGLPTPATRYATVTPEELVDQIARLKAWLALPDHRPRNLRRRAGDIMRAWVVRRDYLGLHGREPTLAAFADAFTARFGLPMTRQVAQKRLALLGILEAAGGPFASTF